MNEVLDNLSFILDQEFLLTRYRIRESDRPEFLKLVMLAQHIARPKALYTIEYVTILSENLVQIGSRIFNSAMLYHNLFDVERVFAYLVTCGRELDDVSFQAEDYLRQFWLDAIKENVLRGGNQSFINYLQERYQLTKIGAMNPGSGDAEIWPIEQQTILFQLFNGRHAEIGVELTPSFLMIPNKTVSGIIFATERDFRTCQVCQRENCPSRSSVFNPQLWETVHAS